MFTKCPRETNCPRTKGATVLSQYFFFSVWNRGKVEKRWVGINRSIAIVCLWLCYVLSEQTCVSTWRIAHNASLYFFSLVGVKSTLWEYSNNGKNKGIQCFFEFVCVCVCVCACVCVCVTEPVYACVSIYVYACVRTSMCVRSTLVYYY